MSKFKNFFLFLQKISFVLDNNKKKLPKLVFLFILISFLDILGIGLLLPLISIISDIQIVNLGFINKVLGNNYFNFQDSHLIFLITILVLLIFLIKTILYIYSSFSIVKFCHFLKAELQGKILSGVQDMDFQNFIKKDTSHYVHHIVSITGQFTDGIVRTILKFSSDIILSIFLIIFLAYSIDTKIFFSFVTLSIIFLISYTFYFKDKLQKLGKISNTSSINLIKSIKDAIKGFKEINILGKNDYYKDYLVENAKKYANSNTFSETLNLSSRNLLELFLILIITMGVLIMFFLLNFTKVEMFSLLTIFCIVALRLIPLFTNFISTFFKLKFHQDALNRIYQDFKMINKKTDIVIKNNKINLIVDKIESLKLEKISFSYNSTKKIILSNFSAEFKKNEIIGVTGQSGSGKSTLFNIILGFLKPNAGKIYYNNTLLNFEKDYWLSNFYLLPQEIFLTNASVKENITLEKNNNDVDDKLYEILKIVQLNEIVKNLPNALDTVLDENGINFSGGQRQRIAIARMIYHNKDFIILSKSTNALDSQTEYEIFNSLKKSFFKEKIVILITHNQKTLSFCDKIYDLAKMNRVIS